SRINDAIIQKFEVEKDTQYEIKLWYQNLIEQMMREGIVDKGHLSTVSKYTNELNNLHNSLLTTIQDIDYQNAYHKAKDDIKVLIIKSGGEAHNEIEACLIGLYGFLMLKLKKAEISEATKVA